MAEIYYNLLFHKNHITDVEAYLKDQEIYINYNSYYETSVPDTDYVSMHLDGSDTHIDDEAIKDDFELAHVPIDIDWGAEWDVEPGRVHIRFNEDGVRIHLYVSEEEENINYSILLKRLKADPIALETMVQETVDKQTPLELDEQQLVNAKLYQTNKLIGL